VNGPAAQASTVRELIDAQAARRPQATYALATEGGAQIRYGELALECRQVSAWLRAHGARPGDTVSLVMPNGLNTLRVLLGAMHGGFVVNPVNLLSQPEQMRHVLAHSDCRVVCVAPEWEARVRGLVEGLDRPVEVIVVVPDGEGLPHIEASTPSTIDFDADAAPHPDALALLMYTSGTTGLPKGVMLTHANLCANAHAISAEHGLTAADRVLAVLPLYHINAFAVTMLAPLAHGGSLAMAPKFSAARFWLQAIESRCTWLNVVPTMVSYLLEGDAAGVPLRAQTDAIRFCRSASAALPPEHHRAFEHRFGIGIIETMGLTETVAPSFSNPLDAAARKLGSVGRASGCEARVIDAALRVVADGVTGELAIRGPNVMRGYYKNDEATRAAFTPDGWLRPRPPRRRRLLLRHRPHQGADHQGRREHRAARDRRGAAAPPRRAGSGRGGYSRPALWAADHGLHRGARGCAVHRRVAARVLRRAPRALQDTQRVPLRRRVAAGPVGQGAAPEAARAGGLMRGAVGFSRAPWPDLLRAAAARAAAPCRWWSSAARR
jgi:acyl-CoA synthetase (AMP-forming)/AMP-acid ligase II